MAKARKHFWLGFLIGLLATLLLAALAVIFVPALRRVVGLSDNAASPTNPPPTNGTIFNELPPVHNESTNIKVSAPEAYTGVASPLTVQGEARVFENVVNLRLKDANGQTLVESTATAASPDVGQFGPFTASLTFTATPGTTGTLEVFTTSAKDGSEVDKVTLPVTFR